MAMNKKKEYLLCVFIIFLSIFSSLLRAANLDLHEKPEFVMAVFVAQRNLPNLLKKATAQNIVAYNINSKSTINLKKRVIKNVIAYKDEKWVYVTEAPFPDVAYDFSIYKDLKPEKRKQTQMLKQTLRDNGVAFINPGNALAAVNNKIKFAKAMHKYGVKHPKSIRYTEENFKKFIANHDLIFLKPIFGSKGYGIITIKKQSTSIDTYSLAYKFKNAHETWEPVLLENIDREDLPEAIDQIREKLSQQNTDYFLQQGVVAYRFIGKQTDFRINMQRGKDGLLGVSGVVVRVGGNLSQGARSISLHIVLNALEQISGLSSETILHRIKSIAIDTFQALEHNAGTRFGDLGMDVVVDEQGRPFIIEANDKNGYFHKYIRKNPKLETLFELPPCGDEIAAFDSAHEDFTIEYARFLSKEKNQQ
jgi:glutathione synthase/RimK-type ligase-like ATP-grasp enzyme